MDKLTQSVSRLFNLNPNGSDAAAIHETYRRLLTRKCPLLAEAV